ncbi:transposase-like protein [Alcanivorax sp. 521-1]|uniref:Transposase-like protein n=1 Tax=Alloalcanivorax profundimaris TaxID=2735259 RepID=A0ABS0AU80_9GAMM|nr:transposase [Alloalcanivorax profundimaris]MBF5057709.1 transposase-like protein [Alloalcanivorax profundimaris]
MTERERLLLTGHAHHLLRQARDGERVFREHTDYVHGVRLLHELAAEHGVALHAWCLLPDRLHLLATPLGDPWGLSVFMKALSCRVALRHRERHRSSSPWRRRYHASPVEPGQWVLAAMCFIERLPIEAGLAVAAYHYPHSSYRTRLGKTDHYPLTDPPEYRRLGDTLVDRAAAYRRYLKEGLDPRETWAIDTAVRRNRLTGSPRFVKEVYLRYGVLCINRGPGRPRKRRQAPGSDRL